MKYILESRVALNVGYDKKLTIYNTKQEAKEAYEKIVKELIETTVEDNDLDYDDYVKSLERYGSVELGYESTLDSELEWYVILTYGEEEWKMEKQYPNIGDKLFLKQQTGDEWVDMVKHPYTVVNVTKNNVYVQACKLVFNGVRYYDTLPDEILEDKEGEIIKLNWAPKKGKWQIDEYKTGYPRYAYFGEWKYQPYLN